MKKAALGGVIGVGKGSERPPRFLKVTYEPPVRARLLALVGKGVMFDSGGLSLKTASGMEDDEERHGRRRGRARGDVDAARPRREGEVTAYVPMVENMPSGNAIRPGDVLKTRNGKTVEVLNTDAEGRLILADALVARGRGRSPTRSSTSRRSPARAWSRSATSRRRS